MRYGTQCLLSDFPGISASEKFFLIGLINQYGVGGKIVGMTVKDLAKSFCVTDTVVSTALTKCIERGYIDRFVSQDSDAGRYGYKLTSTLKYALSENAIRSPQNQGLLDFILDHTNHLQLEKNKKMRPALRMMFAVMVAHSDDFGVIEGLTYKHMKGYLSDLTQDKYRSQIKYLLRYCYIDSHIPGFSSNVVFGKVSSIYLLNLNQDMIKTNMSIGIEPLVYEVNYHSTLSERIYRQMKIVQSDGEILENFNHFNECPKEVLIYMKNLFLDKKVVPHIQFLIMKIASAIINNNDKKDHDLRLSLYWDKLLSGKIIKERENELFSSYVKDVRSELENEFNTVLMMALKDKSYERIINIENTITKKYAMLVAILMMLSNDLIENSLKEVISRCKHPGYLRYQKDRYGDLMFYWISCCDYSIKNNSRVKLPKK